MEVVPRPRSHGAGGAGPQWEGRPPVGRQAPSGKAGPQPGSPSHLEPGLTCVLSLVVPIFVIPRGRSVCNAGKRAGDAGSALQPSRTLTAPGLPVPPRPERRALASTCHAHAEEAQQPLGEALAAAVGPGVLVGGVEHL